MVDVTDSSVAGEGQEFSDSSQPRSQPVSVPRRQRVIAINRQNTVNDVIRRLEIVEESYRQLGEIMALFSEIINRLSQQTLQVRNILGKSVPVVSINELNQLRIKIFESVQCIRRDLSKNSLEEVDRRGEISDLGERAVTGISELLIPLAEGALKRELLERCRSVLRDREETDS